MPKVSVIVPNYNHERYLKLRIDSILNQTFQDFEIILLDDFSTDNSRSVIEGYRGNDKISHIIYNEQNSGNTFFQWRKGLSLAKADLIWIAESDDYAKENFLETLVKPFDIYPDLAVSYCRSAEVDGDGNFLGLTLWADELDKVKWTKDYIEDGFVEVQKYLQYRNTIPNASAVIFRKPKNIDQAVKTDLRFTGDWLFWKTLLLSDNSKIYYSHLPLNHFRNHPQSTRFVTSTSQQEKEIIRFREYKKFVPKNLLNPLEDRYRWMLEEWINRTAGFKSLRYKYFPVLHPVLVLRYYLFSTKKFFKQLFK